MWQTIVTNHCVLLLTDSKPNVMHMWCSLVLHVLLYVVNCLGNILEAIICIRFCFPVSLMNHEQCSRLTRVAGQIVLQLAIIPMAGTEYIWKRGTILALDSLQCAGLFYSLILLCYVLSLNVMSAGEPPTNLSSHVLKAIAAEKLLKQLAALMSLHNICNPACLLCSIDQQGCRQQLMIKTI